MNGVHDMGGTHGHGPVRLEHDEPLFHAAWERRALGVTLAMGATGQWNIDQSRAVRESLPPAQYLGSSYYQIWIAALERLLLQRSLVSAEELAAGRALQPARPLPRVLDAAQVDAVLARGTPYSRVPASGLVPDVDGPATPPRFAVGDRVRARTWNPSGHTRLPRYVRGHVGTVLRCHGDHVYPDHHAADPAATGAPEQARPLYTVVFSASELWGPQGHPLDQVTVEAWEDYLEAA